MNERTLTPAELTTLTLEDNVRSVAFNSDNEKVYALEDGSLVTVAADGAARLREAADVTKTEDR